MIHAYSSHAPFKCLRALWDFSQHVLSYEETPYCLLSTICFSSTEIRALHNSEIIAAHKTYPDPSVSAVSFCCSVSISAYVLQVLVQSKHIWCKLWWKKKHWNECWFPGWKGKGWRQLEKTYWFLLLMTEQCEQKHGSIPVELWAFMWTNTLLQVWDEAK